MLDEILKEKNEIDWILFTMNDTLKSNFLSFFVTVIQFF